MSEIAIFLPMENFLPKEDDNVTMGDGNCAVNQSSTATVLAVTEGQTIKNDIILSERQTPAETRESEDSLHKKIKLLKQQMISLRASSIAFRENMEAVLATIQGISLSHGVPWQVEPSFNGVEEGGLPQFRHSSERRLITGIASRIERTNMSADNVLESSLLSYSPVTPDDKKCEIISDYSNLDKATIEQDIMEELDEDMNAQKLLIYKRQVNNNTEATRPSSESFVTNNQVNMETCIPEDERTNSLPLSQCKDKSLTNKQTLITYETKGVTNDVTNGLRASETSIDSGYHGGNTALAPHGRVCSPASPLAKIYDDVEDKPNTKPYIKVKIPNYLPLSQVNSNYSQLPNENMQLKGSSNDAKSSMTNEHPSAPELPPKKNQTTIKTSKSEVVMKPRVPRSSKKIKMGVSAVTSPLPKTRTIFSSESSATPTSPKPTNQEEEKAEETDNDESSVLRRRSMRMMTEFKLFDFSDSIIGIESNVKSPKATTNKLVNIDGSVKVKKATREADSNFSNLQKNKINRQKRSSVKPKRMESKFSSEPLPSPPLPPPPPAPPSDLQLPNISRVPEFQDFTSIAKDCSKNPVYKVNSNTPISSPICTRKHAERITYRNSPSGVKQLSHASLSPNNVSAFTPVSVATWSDLSLDDLSSPGQYDEKYDRGAQRLQPAEVKVHTPTPIYPNQRYQESPKPGEYAFQRKGSLPLAAISNRSKYKNQIHQNVNAPLTPQVPLKRVQSLRDRRTYNQYPHQAQDLENFPVSFNPDDNAKKVIAALRDAGYKRDASWLTNVGKSSNQQSKADNNKHTAAANIKRSNSTHHKREQNIVKERKEETVVRGIPERAGRNKSTIDIIRASFRGRRGKSVPTNNSSTNAIHEFSTGMPTCHEVKQSAVAVKRDEQSAPPPTSRRNSQNKVKQRVDQKPVTPIPEVAKSRRKKQAIENKQSKSGISLYEKLRNVALKQQITNNNRKTSTDEHSEKRRQRLSSQTSEKSARTNDSYPTGSLASNGSMTSYSSSVNASISSSGRKNKKFSTFV